ncbi:MAG: FAD-dependent oxidoreductase [Novosphingobium sp.]
MTDRTGVPKRIRPLEEVEAFDSVVDVIVCGFGGAGACAAIEARAAGVEVMVLEHASGFGGSTAMSAGEMYLGGGTRLQKQQGFDDTPANMLAYMQQSLGDNGDPERIRAFVDNSVSHFEWLEAQGVVFNDDFYPQRTVCNPDGCSLQYSGNEKSHPFTTVASVAPRGHIASVPAGAGQIGGATLMGVLGGNVENSGATVHYDCRVTALVQDRAGRVVGVVARMDNREHVFGARRGVVLTAGGFCMNEAMTAQYLPTLHDTGIRHGNPNDRGDGILMGIDAGGAAINMGEALAVLAYYPPADLTYGIFVNAQGQRFVNEDIYISRIYHYAAAQRDSRIYMFIDNAHYDRSEYVPGAELVAVGETVAEVEQEAGLPEGALQATVDFYNRHAAQGRDPLFQKSADWLQPFETAPYALVSYDLDRIEPRYVTLGGLKVRTTGEVQTVHGDEVPGLYAAGRTCAGIPRDNLGYCSGFSVGDATMFGRFAGRQVAANAPVDVSVVEAVA